MKGNNEPISDVQTMNIRLLTYYLNLPTVILCHNNTIIHNFMTTRTVLVLVLYVINGRSSFMVAFILVHLLLRRMTVTGFKIKPLSQTMTYLSCFGLLFRISYSFEQYCNPIKLKKTLKLLPYLANLLNTMIHIWLNLFFYISEWVIE